MDFPCEVALFAGSNEMYARRVPRGRECPKKKKSKINPKRLRFPASHCLEELILYPPKVPFLYLNSNYAHLLESIVVDSCVFSRSDRIILNASLPFPTNFSFQWAILFVSFCNRLILASWSFNGCDYLISSLMEEYVGIVYLSPSYGLLFGHLSI